MSFAGFSYADFEDFGLANYGLASTNNSELEDWSKYGLLSFGSALDSPVGMIDGGEVGLAMEYDDDDVVGFAGGSPLVRTKMLEMCPREVAHVRRHGRPRLGAVALGDDGDVYQWQEVPGYGGLFKKIRKRVKKSIRKVAGKVRKVRKGITKYAKKMIKKLPGGKYLVKIYDKVKSVALKVTKPLQKLLGSKVGKYLAPIAALIPGAGPVIATAITVMRNAGKIDRIMNKFQVKRDKEGRPLFKSGKQAKAVQRELAAAARKATKKKRKKGLGSPLLPVGSPEHEQVLAGYGLVGI